MFGGQNLNSPMSGVVRTERRVCGLRVAHGLSGTCLIAVSPRCPPTNPKSTGSQLPWGHRRDQDPLRGTLQTLRAWPKDCRGILTKKLSQSLTSPSRGTSNRCAVSMGTFFFPLWKPEHVLHNHTKHTQNQVTCSVLYLLSETT